MSERLNLLVDEGVGAMLTELAEGERKRGQWISTFVRSVYEQRQQIAVSDIEQIRVGFTGLIGTTRALENRVQSLERRLEAVEGRQ